MRESPVGSSVARVTSTQVRRGALAGAIAGTTAVACMYLAADLTGVEPLPRRLQEPLLSIMPGPVFGFLIDRLQHLGKVVEEMGLVLTTIVLFALVGAAYGAIMRRRPMRFTAIVLAIAIWVLVGLTLEPLSGGGLFGLQDGISAPIVLLGILAVYAVVLELSCNRLDRAASEAEADPGRRRVVIGLPVAIAAGSIGVLLIRLGPGWYRSAFQPAEAGLNGQSPELTPAANFYVVSKNFSDPVVSEKGWSLSVQGLVDRSMRLSYDDLRGLPAVSQFVTMECISNNVGGPQMSTGKFTGVSLPTLIGSASPKASATSITFKARDGYSSSLPLSLVSGAPEILVVYMLEDAPLTTAHGFPARLLVPGHYGMKGPKWLDQIELTPGDQGGYWENQGWDRQALVKTMARIDSPADGDLVSPGSLTLAGVAFAGARGISAVELSVDGGAWLPADLKPPLSELTWTLWSLRWTALPGSHTLRVRARDGRGDLQTSQTAPSFPSGSSGYHTIRVDVSH